MRLSVRYFHICDFYAAEPSLETDVDGFYLLLIFDEDSIEEEGVVSLVDLLHLELLEKGLEFFCKALLQFFEGHLVGLEVVLLQEENEQLQLMPDEVLLPYLRVDDVLSVGKEVYKLLVS